MLLIIFQSAIHIPHVGAVDLYACGTRLLAQQNQDAAQNSANATELPPSLIISYEQCLEECGPGLGDIDWPSFSQNFGSWFLPWISLMFQIPFGAEREF